MRTYITIGCAYIIVGCMMAVLAFYEFYCTASHSQKAPELRPLLAKSIKRAGACFLLLGVFTISQMVCKHYHAGFVISFMVSVLLSLCFVGFCYKLGWCSNKRFAEKKGKEKT